MPYVKIHNVGRIGIINDVPAHELPPEAWTDGNNVRMYDGAVWKSFGYTKIMDPPSITPYALLPAFTASGSLIYVYPGLAAAYATDGVTHQEVTRLAGAYTGAISDRWNGGNLGAVTILNNGVDIPQAWINPALATRLIDLANWPANTIAQVVRPFKRFLVAYDVTKNGTRIPQLVKWSNRAEPGAVPTSWDETDPNERTGEWPLIDTDGAIVDALALGDVNFVYKEDEIHTMEEIGGNFVFRFRRRFGQAGLLAQRCVQLYQKREQHIHVLMTPEDIVRHDGVNMTSLLDDKLRRWYKGRNDPSKSDRCFLVPNYAEEEMWAGIIEAGEEFPNLLLILNLKDGTTTIQEIPSISYMAWAAFDPNAGATTFDAQTIPFDELIGQFGQRLFSPGRKRLLMVQPDTPAFLLADQGFQQDGNNFSAFIERQGLTVVGQDRLGNPKVDTETIKLVTEVWPRVRTLNGTKLNVYVGAQETLEAPIDWTGPLMFDAATEQKVDVDPPVSGRYIAVRFESTADSDILWKLDGYDLQMNLLGRY